MATIRQLNFLECLENEEGTFSNPELSLRLLGEIFKKANVSKVPQFSGIFCIIFKFLISDFAERLQR